MNADPVEQYFAELQRVGLGELNERLRALVRSAASDPAQASLFREEGVVIREALVPRQLVDAANAELDRIDDLVRDSLYSVEDFNLEADGGGWRGKDGGTVSHRGKLRKIKNLFDHGEAFEEIAFSQELVGLITAILGGDGVELHSKGFLMNKPPGVVSVKDLHQDSAYFPASDDDADVLTAWIPLQRATEENGTLRVLPGSHKWGPLPHSEGEATLDLAALDRSSFVSCVVEAGGVALADKHLIHYSDSNHGDRPRRALIIRYRRASRRFNGGKIRVAGEGKLGGGPSAEIAAGEVAAHYEKRHLILNRLMGDRALRKGQSYYDLGTDYHYPFYREYLPTTAALDSLASHAECMLSYPSSYGLPELRTAVAAFAARQFGIDLHPHENVMITTGASQAFDALSRSLAGDYVLLPDLSLPTVATIARGNGARLLRIPINRESSLMDLEMLQAVVRNIAARGESVRFLYLNSPCNPNGAVADEEYLGRLVDIARESDTLLLHDMDSWHTRHVEDRVPNLLEIPGASEYAASILSISKEFGLPGARVGFLVGNKAIIDHVRTHNSLFCVMIPEICQHGALAALNAFERDPDRPHIDEEIREGLSASVRGWRELGWPPEKIVLPAAGFKYLVGAPPRIASENGYSPAELFDYFVASRAFVKFSTSHSFNPNNRCYIRIVVMQEASAMDEVFERLASCGVHYDMELPPGIADEFSGLLLENGNSDF